MAAGVPIIARRDDSIKKVIRDKIDGRLFDSPDSIPSILADLFSDPATAELYAKNAFAALAPFSSEVFGERVEDVYLHTIDRKRVKMGQKKDSMVKTPMPGALRHLRLETLHPDTDKKRNNKHTHHHRNHQ
jgi:hypothetical protein